MADSGDTMAVDRHVGAFAPLQEPIFRRVWVASLFTNFGQLIQGVGAAWAMTEMTGRADRVALVQTALFAPMMCFSLIAGAIADSYDRRKVSLVALLIALLGATCLTLVSLFGLLTPTILLSLCFMVGSGMTLLNPSWQASVREQVPKHHLAQAITLNSISYNIARSFGPAIGGALVAVAGVISAFSINALFYLPNLIVMFLWRRPREPSRLPPEGLGRAMISGIRYTIHSPPLRAIWLRTLVIGLIGASTMALLPLIARDVLHGQASLYGILAGCFGAGAVVGAVFLGDLRRRMSDESALTLCLAIYGPCLIGIGLSRNAIITGLLLMIGSAPWMIASGLFNISMQMSSPRWVMGRALAAYVTAICGGLAVGGWLWGVIAASHGTPVAMVVSGVAMIASILLGRIWRMPEVEEPSELRILPHEPDTNLELTGRSGPIVIVLEYRVAPDRARSFYRAMQEMQSIRHRTGGYGWSLERDIGDPELWTERYHTPTWHDYLRQRTRMTRKEYGVLERVIAFHCGDQPVRVVRKLERPYGSVRWDDAAPDRGTIMPLPPEGA